MTWLDVLVASAWKGTIVLAAAFLAVAALRRASAAVRHFVWTAALAALLALPVALRIAPQWDLPAASARLKTAAQTPSAAQPARSVPAQPASHPALPSDWWFVIWLVGVVVRQPHGLVSAAPRFVRLPEPLSRPTAGAACRCPFS